jgi:hypothetical protein
MLSDELQIDTNIKQKNNLDNSIINFFDDEVILLVKYIPEMGKDMLFTGTKIEQEITNIKKWERTNYLRGTLSSKYEAAHAKLHDYGYIYPCSVTGWRTGNEFGISGSFRSEQNNLCSESQEKIKEIVEKNGMTSFEKLIIDYTNL